MSVKSTTVQIAVNSAGKTILLAASATRREWLISNSNAVGLMLFFDSSAVAAVTFANNILAETDAMENYNGLIEGQMVSGGAVNIEVTSIT